MAHDALSTRINRICKNARRHHRSTVSMNVLQTEITKLLGFDNYHKMLNCLRAAKITADELTCALESDIEALLKIKEARILYRK